MTLAANIGLLLNDSLRSLRRYVYLFRHAPSGLLGPPPILHVTRFREGSNMFKAQQTHGFGGIT